MIYINDIDDFNQSWDWLKEEILQAEVVSQEDFILFLNPDFNTRHALFYRWKTNKLIAKALSIIKKWSKKMLFNWISIGYKQVLKSLF